VKLGTASPLPNAIIEVDLAHNFDLYLKQEKETLSILQGQRGQDSTADNGTDRAHKTCRHRCRAGELLRTDRGCRLRGYACARGGLNDDSRRVVCGDGVDGCTVTRTGCAGLVFSVRSVRGVGEPILSRGYLPGAGLGECGAVAGGARIDGWRDVSRARWAVGLFTRLV
jgi:hypothetical protein